MMTGCFFNAANIALTVVIETKVDFMEPREKNNLGEGHCVSKALSSCRFLHLNLKCPRMSALKSKTIVKVLNL